jgi:hypothetical protein
VRLLRRIGQPAYGANHYDGQFVMDRRFRRLSI